MYSLIITSTGFLDYKGAWQHTYGTFHIACMVIALILAALIVIYAKKLSEKASRIIIGAAWATLVVFEILKELNFSISITDGVMSWDYQWYIFPFQFCSMPLYLLPFAFLLKEGRVRDGFLSFIASYSFFAGTIVFFVFPEGCFVDTILINIQTMLHHGTQFLLGVFVFCRYREKITLKFFARGIIVFLGCMAVALALDYIMYPFMKDPDVFNMFYISPYYESALAVVGPWKEKMPYVCFLGVYVFGFTFSAFVVYMAGYLCVNFKKLFHLKTA